jgi:hypothetical protein
MFVPINFVPANGNAFAVRPTLARQEYMQQKVDNWECNKSFEICFADLTATAKNKSQYTLPRVAAFIDNEVTSQSKDFEVVGIKFPREDLTRWGILLLCSILAYFCLHLRELSPRVSVKDDGLEVAWLGLYSSWYAQCLLWLSLVGLPSIAVLLLGARGAKYEFLRSPKVASSGASLIDSWVSLTVWILLPLAICATLGILSCLSAMKLAKLADNARNSPDAESATDLRSMD